MISAGKNCELQQTFDLSFLPSSFLYPNGIGNKCRVIFIKHEAIIPASYLPTFNSNVLEIYLHRIPNLSEIYMYLNDDMMLVRPLDIGRILPTKLTMPIVVPASKQIWFCNATYLQTTPRMRFHFTYINTVNLFMSKFNNTCYPWTQGGWENSINIYRILYKDIY
jgi:hypothetical protein